MMGKINRINQNVGITPKKVIVAPKVQNLKVQAMTPNMFK